MYALYHINPCDASRFLHCAYLAIENGSSLQIIVIGQFAKVLAGSVGGILNMTGNQISGLRSSAISFFVMLLLMLCLTPTLGVIGAAIAQSVSVIANMILLSIACYQNLGFTPFGVRKP